MNRLTTYIDNMRNLGTLPIRTCDESAHCPVCGLDHEYMTILNALGYWKIHLLSKIVGRPLAKDED